MDPLLQRKVNKVEVMANPSSKSQNRFSDQTSTYFFKSDPSIPWIRPKFRPAEQPLPPTNIMTDRRVCRGPAHLHHPVPALILETTETRKEGARRRSLARRKAQLRSIKIRLGTPPPVDGRKHEDIQTEEYLEEIFDHPLEMTISTQTDVHLDRPPSPPYIPMKSGVDESSQICPGELYEFNVEVKPVLEVLVGKTLEQALIEVVEEDELAAIQEQQRRFKELKDSELAENVRLESLERRKKEEMEMRILEQESVMKVQQETQDRIAAAVLTTGYISDLLPSVFSGMRNASFMTDHVEDKVEDHFMSWLINEVKTEMQRLVDNKDILSGYTGDQCPKSRAVLEDMLSDIVQTRAEMYRALGEKDNKHLGQSDEETEEFILPDYGEELGEQAALIPYIMKGDDQTDDLT